MRGAWLAGLVLLGMVAGAGVRGVADGPGVGGAPGYAADRADRAKGLTEPYGWFSLVALEWLKPGVTTVGSAKDNNVVLAGAPAHLMRLEQADGAVKLDEAAPGLTLEGQPARAGMTIGTDEKDASALAIGTLRVWAIDRGGKRYLRVKDSNAPALKHFHGLRWYAPAAKYRVEARWVPYATRAHVERDEQAGADYAGPGAGICGVRRGRQDAAADAGVGG